MRLRVPTLEFLVWADHQIQRWPTFARLSARGLNDRFEHCLSVFDQLLDYAVKHRIKLAFFDGDLYEEIGEQETVVYSMTARKLRMLTTQLQVHLLPGNHDVAQEGMDEHALVPFGGVSGLVVHDRWEVFLTPAATFHFIPWYKTAEVFFRDFEKSRAYARRHLEVPHILHLHQGFRRGSVAGDQGYDPDEGLRLTDKALAPFLAGFTGHYHPFKRLPFQTPFYQVGSPLHHTKGDHQDLGKGFLHIKLYAGEEPEVIRVPVTGTPEFRVFEISDYFGVNALKKLDLTKDFVFLNIVDPKVTPEDLKVIKCRELRIDFWPTTDDKGSPRQPALGLNAGLDEWIGRAVVKRHPKGRHKELIRLLKGELHAPRQD